MPEFVGFEGWFDDDPGLGLGITVDDIDPELDAGQAFIQATVTNLDLGIHQFGIRGRDENGNFSTTTVVPFLVIPEEEPIPILDRIEVFFDDDPGFDNGFFAFSAGDGEVFGQIPLDAITPGIHELGLRVSDDSGDWSTTLFRTVVILEQPTPIPNLIGYEYFFEQEPGIGSATLVDITPTDDFSGFVNIPVEGLSQGEHQVFIRFIDENGEVGTTYYQIFTVTSGVQDCVDFNNDGAVNGTDLLAFLGAFGNMDVGCEGGDFNDDNVVSGADLLVFLSFFNQ
ncbi:MAG: hypothetical protein AAF193_07740 [Bacteroidota bacterium]